MILDSVTTFSHDKLFMSSAEQLYQTAVDKMSIKERVARSVELFNWSREFMGRQIRSENPDMSDECIKLLVALRTHGRSFGCAQKTVRSLIRFVRINLEREPTVVRRGLRR